jgi:2-hydroxychromene-2-carboxylate isomerase
MAEIEYFYGPQSVFAYLGHARLLEIAKAGGRSIHHRPVDLRQVVAAAHPQSFAKRSPAHRSYYFGREIERWGEYRNVPLKGGIPSNHASDTTLASCLLIAAIDQGGADQLALAMMTAHWRDHADLGDRDILLALVRGAGIDAGRLAEAANTPQINAILAANTSEAIQRSFFGSPTYVVDGDMFYGQDRLEMVERALSKPFARTWS